MTQTLPSSCVAILPESDAHTLCVRLTGLVSKEDYAKNFGERLAKIANEQGRFSLCLIYGPDYKGWEPGAAELSFKSIIDYGKKAARLAYVNPPESKILQIKLAKPLFSGDIRFFNTDEEKKALAWVKESAA